MRDRNIFDARTIFLLVFLFAPVSIVDRRFRLQFPEAGGGAAGTRSEALRAQRAAWFPSTSQNCKWSWTAADIPGFMMAMTMGYDVKNPNLLDPLSPEDQIKADVVVNGNDVYLENIVVVKKADQAKTPASSDAHPATPKPDKQ